VQKKTLEAIVITILLYCWDLSEGDKKFICRFKRGLTKWENSLDSLIMLVE